MVKWSLMVLIRNYAHVAIFTATLFWKVSIQPSITGDQQRTPEIAPWLYIS